MKTTIINIAFSLLISSSLHAQERLVSTVYFESGMETIEGLLIRSNNKENTPAVVFNRDLAITPLMDMRQKPGGHTNII